MHERQAWSQKDTRLEQPHCIHAFGELHKREQGHVSKSDYCVSSRWDGGVSFLFFSSLHLVSILAYVLQPT
jgi:hypothetical protein